MRNTLCLLILVAGCADSSRGGDGGFFPADLATPPDLARARPADMATPPDLTPTDDSGSTDDGGTDDGGTTPDMVTPIPGDMAMKPPADMAMMIPADMVMIPADMVMTMLPADMVMIPADMVMTMLPVDMAMLPADMAGMPPVDMAMPPIDMAMLPTDMAGMVPVDMAKPPVDMALLPGDMAGKPDMVMLGDGGICHIVVNEIETGSSTSASEEFVELYNPCPAAVDLTNFSLVYRSAANVNAPDATGDNTTKVYPAGGMLPSKGYYTACTTVFQANALGMKCDAIYGTSGILSGTGGGVGVRDPNGVLLDSIGYGTATNSFVEKAAAPAPPNVPTPGNSIGRIPNGTDTNNNMADVKVSTAPTPGAANM